MAAMRNTTNSDSASASNVSAQSKNSWVWIALAATVGASIWVSLSEESIEEPHIVSGKQVATSEGRKTRNSRLAPIPAENSAMEWQRPVISDKPKPLFGSANDETADMEAQPELPPEAPALPFIYAGKLVEDGTYTIFLLSGQRSFAVQPGDVIEDVWRLKVFKPPEVVFDYLPLKIETVMNIGESIE